MITYKYIYMHEGLGVSRWGMGQRWPAAGLGVLTVAVHAWDLLKEVAIIFITSTIVYCYCCEVTSVVSDSVWPHRQPPTRLPVPGILQARTVEWVAISFSNAWKWKVKVKSLSRVRPSATPWTAAFQAPPSMGFSRQESRSGVHTCNYHSLAPSK